jgi:mercuric ion transport protein
MPAVAVSLLPKAVCPICSPAYAALLSSLGLGFLATAYLLPVTVGFLVVALVALGFRAGSRHGLGPFTVGLIATACVLSGKFWFSSDSTTYVGIGLLVVASVCNAIPKRRSVCPACLRTERSCLSTGGKVSASSSGLLTTTPPSSPAPYRGDQPTL